MVTWNVYTHANQREPFMLLTNQMEPIPVSYVDEGDVEFHLCWLVFKLKGCRKMEIIYKYHKSYCYRNIDHWYRKFSSYHAFFIGIKSNPSQNVGVLKPKTIYLKLLREVHEAAEHQLLSSSLVSDMHRLFTVHSTHLHGGFWERVEGN